MARTKECPWGLDNLPDYELKKVRIGNQCVKSALKIIRWLDKQGLPWCLENPHSSKLWYLPPVESLCASSHTQTIVVDFCQYKMPWRKRTRLIFGNVEEVDLGRFASRRCNGSQGICSRAQQKHFQLTGSSPDGTPWTRRAQPYPTGLCHDLVHALLSSYKVVPS